MCLVDASWKSVRARLNRGVEPPGVTITVEPVTAHYLHAEIASADQIDLIMAFVRYGRLQPTLEIFQRHCADGRALRVPTTVSSPDFVPHDRDKFIERLGATQRSSGELLLSPIELRLDRGVSAARPPSELAGLGNRYRQDRDGSA